MKPPDEHVAFEKEKELIKRYGRRDLKTGSLTNLTEGGDGPSGKICTPRERLNKRLSHLGEKNYMFGKKHTFEALEKMRERRRNRKTNYHHTVEWKRKLKNSPLILRSQKNSLPVYQISLSGDIVKKWPSVNVATLSMQCHNSRIYICTKNNHRICKGFYWVYEKEAQVRNNKILNINELNKKRLTPHVFRRIAQHTLDGKLVKIWDSYLNVKREMGLDNSILSNIIRGKRKSNIYGGFVWLPCP